MPHFLMVIVFDLAKVTYCSIQTFLVLIIVLFFGLTKLGCIDSCSGDETFVPILFLAILLALLFSGPIDGLGLLLLLGSSFLRSSLRFVNSKVFCWLGLSLGRGGIYWLIASVVILIDVLPGGGLYLGLCFSFSYSLD